MDLNSYIVMSLMTGCFCVGLIKNPPSTKQENQSLYTIDYGCFRCVVECMAECMGTNTKHAN